jgi:hypothetical protein
MLSRKFFAIPFLLLLLTPLAGDASGTCQSNQDVFFKQTMSQQLSVPIGYSALGDMDGDGKKDLVGVTVSTQRRTDPVNIVFYKRSANGFDIAPVVTSVGSGFNTTGLELIDIDNDGKRDLVNINSDGGNITVTSYLGNGSGGFTLGVATNLGYYFSNRSFGDLDGDGKPDLVAGFSGSLSYHLQQANGTFGPSNSLAPTGLGFVRDFNNDGKNDVLVWSSTIRYVLYNQGNAQFTAGPNIPIVPAFFIGDFKDLNGDGRLDFVTNTYSVGNNAAVALHFGQANGGFTVTEKLMDPAAIGSTGIGDADGDGDSDLLIFGQKAYAVGTNDGSGQFTMSVNPAPQDTVVFIGNLPATLDDFNGDGRVDLISMNRDRIFKEMPDVVKIRENTCTRIGQTKFVDFDGDGQTDLSYFRPSDGTWLYRSTRTNSDVSIQFGTTGDVTVPQDYDGDSMTDRAIFRPSTGDWYLKRSTTGDVSQVHWGANGDKPVPSDYDGDGKADIAVYRPSNGSWWILKSSDGNYTVYNFGISEDVPVPMDYDGDGKSDVAVFRPSSGYWWIQKSIGGYYVVKWGIGTDKPIPGDYDNDGIADLAVYRPSERVWYLFRLRDNVWKFFLFGSDQTDVVVPITRPAYGLNIAIYRPGVQELWEDTQSTRVYNGFGNNKIVSTILPQN